MLAAGVALGSDPAPRLSAGDVTAGRRLFAAGAYTRLDEVLLLLDGAAHSTEHGPAGAARAADVWVLASQLALKKDRTEAAGSRPTAAELDAAGMTALTAAQARQPATAHVI